jgi:hypothetical protein
MNSKKTIAFFFVLILTLSMAAAQKVNSQSEVIVSVSPTSIIDVPKSLSTITVNITFSFTEGLNSWDIRMRYNPILLQTNSSLITLGPLFRTMGSSFSYFELDTLHIGWLIPSQDWVDGEGNLVTITFVVRGSGETSLDLYSARLADYNGNPFPSTCQSGYFRNADSALMPRARFIYYADSYNATFNASSSFSPQTSIQKYFWLWDDPSSQQTNTTEPVIWHKYLEKIPPQNESASVRLIVTDSMNITSNVLLRVIMFGIAVHDVAIISIEASPRSVLVGNFSGTTISVNVTNRGNQQENASVTVSYNSTFFDFNNITATQWTPLQMQPVNRLAGFENRTAGFFWNTTGFALGFYALKAEASKITGEANKTNNVLTGSIRIVSILFAPVSSLAFSPGNPKAGESVLFDGSGSYDPDGKINSYDWSFGDSSRATTSQPLVNHAYQKAGVFNVTLAVTDDDGFSKNATVSLVISKLVSAVSISLLPSVVVVSVNVAIKGRIVSVESPANVTIFYRVYGQFLWDILGNTTTDLEGVFSYNWLPSKPGAYQFKALWEGDDRYFGASSDVVLTTAKLRGDVSLFSSRDSVIVDDTLEISGYVTPAHYGAIVAILYKQDNSSWSILTRIATDEIGRYSLDWEPTAIGTYQLKAEWDGDDHSIGAESLVTTITVVPRSGFMSYLPYFATAVIIVLIVVLFWVLRRGNGGSK